VSVAAARYLGIDGFVFAAPALTNLMGNAWRRLSSRACRSRRPYRDG
jgi:hypothetical protein